MNYLLSYPRSGNTWLRFIIEWFSGRPSSGLSKSDAPIYKAKNSTKDMNRLIKKPLKHVGGNIIIQKAHIPSQVKKRDGKLILLIRNPMEAITRHTKKLKKNEVDIYMSNIRLYDKWNDKNKVLIYYEDLLTNPRKEIEKVVKLLNLDVSKIDYFMDNYDEFFDLSVNFYNNKGNLKTSETKGKKLIHHSLGLSDEEVTKFKKSLNTTYPQIISYLDKYNIKND